MGWHCDFCDAKEGEPCKSVACQRAAKIREERDELRETVKEIAAVREADTLRQKAIAYGNLELRKWIQLYSECDCDVSKNKGMSHWFACRYVLGQRALALAPTQAEDIVAAMEEAIKLSKKALHMKTSMMFDDMAQDAIKAFEVLDAAKKEAGVA